MKKKKKAHKQQAAAERKEEKEKKKQEKLQKKQEKEQLKAEKAEQKRLAKEQKKAEKAAAKKHKGEEVQEKVEESKGQKRPHEDSTTGGNIPCETAAPDNGHFKTKGLKRAVTTKRTKRKLLTLRRGSLAKKKKTTVKSHAPKKAKRSAAGSIASAAATSTAEKNTEEPYQETKQQEEPYCESIQPSAGSASKQGNPVLQHKTQQKKQNKHGEKQHRKQASKKSPAAKTNKKKIKPEPCPKIIKLVQQVLLDCKATNCVHPTWETMTFDAKTYQLSVYWTRKAVGLKMPKALVQGKLTSKRSKKAKGKSNWAQVQYFSCKTSCVYSNLLLAYEFVSRCWII